MKEACLSEILNWEELLVAQHQLKTFLPERSIKVKKVKDW
jgi:hypothetical protein